MSIKRITAIIICVATLVSVLLITGCGIQPADTVSDGDAAEQSTDVSDNNSAVTELYDPPVTTEWGYMQAVIVKWGKVSEDQTDAVKGYVFVDAEVLTVFEETFIGSTYLNLAKEIAEYKSFLVPQGLADFITEGDTALIFADMLSAPNSGPLGVRSGTGLIIPVEENCLVLTDELLSIQNNDDMDSMLSGNEYIKNTLEKEGPMFRNGMTVQELDEFFALLCKVLDE